MRNETCVRVELHWLMLCDEGKIAKVLLCTKFGSPKWRQLFKLCFQPLLILQGFRLSEWVLISRVIRTLSKALAIVTLLIITLLMSAHEPPKHVRPYAYLLLCN